MEAKMGKVETVLTPLPGGHVFAGTWEALAALDTATCEACGEHVKDGSLLARTVCADAMGSERESECLCEGWLATPPADVLASLVRGLIREAPGEQPNGPTEEAVVALHETHTRMLDIVLPLAAKWPEAQGALRCEADAIATLTFGLADDARALRLAYEATCRPVERTPEVGTTYTRAQLAAAVDDAHSALHEAEEAEDTGTLLRRVTRAHEALHSVGAGQERIACATLDPEAQAIHADLRALRDREIPCGHTVADLIGGTEKGPDGKERPSITKCGACLAIRQPEIIAARQAKEAAKAAERTPAAVLRAMLAEREAAVVAAETAMYRVERPSITAQAGWVRAKDAYENMRATLATYLATGELLPYLTVSTDYLARLNGSTPLDAPPAEVP